MKVARVFLTVIVLLSFFVLQTALAQSKASDSLRWSNVKSNPYAGNVVQSMVRTMQTVPVRTTLRTTTTVNGSVSVYPNIQIHPSTITTQSEISVAMHPENPAKLFVGSNAVHYTTSFGSQGWYYTTDEGQTWSGSDTLPTHNDPNDFLADPSVAIGSDGTLFFNALLIDDRYRNFAFVTRSTDEGGTWSQVLIPGSEGEDDKNHMTVDNSPNSPYLNNIYTAFTDFRQNSYPVVFSRSTNSGKSFSPRTVISDSVGTFLAQGVNLAVGINGEVYAAWSGYDTWPPTTSNLGFAKSTNGGETWESSRSIATVNDLRGYLRKGNESIRVSSFPSIAVDYSNGSRRGWMYIVYADKQSSQPDIMLIRSTDGGDTWSTPKRVNTDNTNLDQWMPWIAVDKATGVLFVTYYDSRNFPANDSAEVFVSFSVDGGESFDDVLVSDVPFLPASIDGLAGGYMGDYIGIVAANGTAWPCWNDNRTGIHQVYTAKVQLFDMQMTKRIHIDKDSLLFDDVFVGMQETLHVSISNIGLHDTLEVTDISSTHGKFQPLSTSFSIPPLQGEQLSVLFSQADSQQVYEGELLISSNDSLQPVLHLPMKARSILPPEIHIAPLSFDYDLQGGDSVETEMMIRNSGNGTLQFELNIESGTTSNVKMIASYKEQIMERNEDFSMNKRTMRQSSREESRKLSDYNLNGVSILFDAYHSYADTYYVPLLVKDLKNAGAEISIMTSGAYDYDVLKQYSMLFILEANYYLPEHEVEELKRYLQSGGGLVIIGDDYPDISSDWTSFAGITAERGGYSGVTSDITPHEVTNNVEQLYFGSVLSVLDVISPATSLVRLSGESIVAASQYGSGKIVFITDDDILGTYTLYDNSVLLMNSFQWAGTETWLILSQQNGEVSPHDSLPVSIKIHTKDLLGGTYNRMLVASSNDPQQPEVRTPVNIRVHGVPDMIVNDEVQFGKAYVGYPKTVNFSIVNDGTDSLLISTIASDNSEFTVLQPTPFSVQSLSSIEMQLQFIPTQEGNRTGQIIISSNDPDTPFDTVNVFGVGNNPPHIEVNPNSLSYELNVGDSIGTTLQVTNSGSDTLSFTLGTGLVQTMYTATHQNKNTLPWFTITLPEKETPPELVHQIPDAEEKSNLLPTLDLHGVNILIDRVHSYYDTSYFMLYYFSRDMKDAGATVSLMTGGEYTFEELSNYDFIIVVEPNTELSISERAALQQYLESGGGLFIIGDDYPQITSTWTDFAGIIPQTGGYSGITGDLTYHPVTQNVDTLSFTSVNATLTVEEPAISLARISGETVLAVSTIGGGNIVFSVDESTLYNYFSYDNRTMFLNAVEWLAGSAWLKYDPILGKLLPDSSATIRVSLNAEHLLDGLYRTKFVFQSNDPATPELAVPLDVTVHGAPSIAVPESLLFEPTFVNYSTSTMLEIRSNGTDTLIISNIQSDNPDFSPFFGGPTFIPPNQKIYFTVSFHSQAVGVQTGTLSVFSNDATNPVVTVRVIGEAIEPPQMEVTPTEITLSVTEGDSIASQFSITNNGLGTLEYHLTSEAQPGVAASQLEEKNQGEFFQQSLTASFDASKDGTTSNEFHENNTRSAPSIDLMGKKILFSRYYNGFDTSSSIIKTLFQDLRDAGAEVVVKGFYQLYYDSIKQYSTIILIEPSSNLYSDERDDVEEYIRQGGSLFVCGDDYVSAISSWVSFAKMNVYEEQVSGITSDIKPHPVTYEVDTLMFSAAYARIKTSSYSRPIVRLFGKTLAAVGTYGEGKIVCITDDNLLADYDQYDNRTFVLNSFAWLSSPAWLDYSPDSGIVPANSSEAITLRANASALGGGKYKATIKVTSNDPLNTTEYVAVNFTVIGAPNIVLLTKSVDFGNVFIGYPDTTEIVVRNSGSVPLSITNIVSSNSKFVPLDSVAFELPPKHSDTLRVRYFTEVLGVDTGTLSISSNDSTDPVATVALRGVGVYPPHIEVTPDSLSFTLNYGDTSNAPFTLKNTGLGTLEFEIETNTETSRFLGIEPQSERTPDELQSVVPVNLQGLNILFDAYHSSWDTSTSVITELVRDLRQAGANINVLRNRFTADTLSRYSAIMILNPYYSLQPNEVTALTEFVQRGGHVFICGENYISNLNQWTSYAGINFVSQYFSGGIITDITPHEVTANVDTLRMSYLYAYITNSGVATSLARISGNTLLAVSEYYKGRVVAISSPNVLSYYTYNDNKQMLLNSFGWFAGKNWLSVLPEKGTIPSNTNRNLTATVRTASLEGGTYNGQIRVKSNDPERKTVEVSVRLRVIGVPNIALAPVSLDFGDGYIGFADTLSLTIYNRGTDSLNIQNIQSSNLRFSVAGEVAFKIPPKQKRNVVVQFTPIATGTQTGMLTVSSNDPDSPQLTVQISGRGIYPPHLSVFPTSLDVILNEGDSLVIPLTFTNTGLGTLNFSISTEELDTSSSLLRSVENASGEMTEEEKEKQLQQVKIFSLESSSITATSKPLAGMKVLFDRVHTYYDTSVSPVRNIIRDIRNLGATISVLANQGLNSDTLAQYSILLVYDPNYNELTSEEIEILKEYVQKGGGLFVVTDYNGRSNLLWTLFSGITTVFNNNNFSGYGNEITSHPLTQNVDTLFVSTRISLNISSPAISLVRLGGLTTTAASEYGMGRIVCLSSQNPIANYDYYDHKTFIRNAFSWLGSIRWLSATPDTGTITSGNSMIINALFHAEEIDSGKYYASLNIQSNDPALTLRKIPVQLTVNPAPSIALKNDSLDFEEGFIGYPDTLLLEIQNNGSDTLRVTSINSNQTEFSTTNQSGFVISPHGKYLLHTTFIPTQPGAVQGIYTLLTNDPSDSLVNIFVRGIGVHPPHLLVSTDTLRFVLNSRDSLQQNFPIENSGLGGLKFDIKRKYQTTRFNQRNEIVASGNLSGIKILFDKSRSSDTSSFIQFFSDVRNVGAEIISMKTGRLSFDTLLRYSLYMIVNPYIKASQQDIETLKRFMNAGGGVFVAGNNSEIVSSWTDFAGMTSEYSYNSGMTSEITSHEISENISSIYIQNPNVAILVQPPSLSIVRLSGKTMVAVSSYGIGNIVCMSDAVIRNLNSSADNKKLALNIIEWTGKPSWMNVTPSSGMVASNQTLNAGLNVRCGGLSGGLYEGSIVLSSNDPARKSIVIPATLQVKSSPKLVSSVSSIEFGEVTFGYSDTTSFIIRNEGSDDLLVGSMSIDNTDFSIVGGTTFTVPSYKSKTVFVAFHPSSIGNANAHLQIVSNDSDKTNFHINVQGIGVLPSQLSVSPDTLSFLLNKGDRIRSAITVNNSGAGLLRYDVEVLPGSPFTTEVIQSASDTTKGKTETHIELNSAIVAKWIPAPGNTRGLTWLNNSLWAVVENFGGYKLYEIDTSDGTIVSQFPIYGGTYFGLTTDGKDLFICNPTNEQIKQYTPTGLYVGYISTGSISDVHGIAWDGTYFWIVGTTASKIVKMNKSGTIFQTFSVQPNQISLPEDMEWVGSKTNGKLWMADAGSEMDINEISIGSSSFQITRELPFPIRSGVPKGVAYDGKYLWLSGYNSTYIYAIDEKKIGMPWLSVSEDTGTVLPASSDSFHIEINTTELLCGNSVFAQIILNSNDPVHPRVIVPVKVQVLSESNVTASKDTLNFDETFVGYKDTVSFFLSNPGCDTLRVQTIAPADSVFYVLTSTPLQIPPAGSKTISVMFKPYESKRYYASLQIVSSDPRTPVLEIPMRATSLFPPIVSVSHDSIVALLPTDSTTSVAFSINNQGASPLRFTLKEGFDNTLTSANLIGDTTLFAAGQDGKVRGNIFYIYKNILLREFKCYLDITYATGMRFVVYSATSSNGVFTKIKEITIPNSGTGRKFYSSGAMEVPLEKNKYYFIGVAYIGTIKLAYKSVTLPMDVQFGSLVSAATINKFPPPDTVTPSTSSIFLWTQSLAVGTRIFASFVPESGVVEAGNVEMITATIQTPDDTGRYRSSILVSSNDPATPVKLIPVRVDVVLDVTEEGTVIPKQFALHQSYPNPFNPTTTVRFDVPNEEVVVIKIFNVLGQEVATLLNERMTPGSYKLRWDASNYPTGLYMVRMQAGDISSGSGQVFSDVKRMLLVK
ncbi:MAG: choice-of-anchor D domain-containing protein [Ignavibacteriae bacterium]|nr:choice-of-anchor D domain-containing protein [Ignavibacteriota bacterium]